MNSKLTKKLMLTAALFASFGAASLAGAEGEDLGNGSEIANSGPDMNNVDPGTSTPVSEEYKLPRMNETYPVPTNDGSESDPQYRAPTPDDGNRVAEGGGRPDGTLIADGTTPAEPDPYMLPKAVGKILYEGAMGAAGGAATTYGVVRTTDAITGTDSTIPAAGAAVIVAPFAGAAAGAKSAFDQFGNYIFNGGK